PGHVPDRSGTCPRPLRDMSPTTPGYVPDRSGTCPRSLRDMSPTAPGHVPDRSGTCPRVDDKGHRRDVKSK
ncbi:MAG: hypothetical protein LBG30_03015, partial [Odoribacteraceae bacterium]|nr:hypothetical protein [Odoribacteraceae bacterium]